MRGRSEIVEDLRAAPEGFELLLPDFTRDS